MLADRRSSKKAEYAMKPAFTFLHHPRSLPDPTNVLYLPATLLLAMNVCLCFKNGKLGSQIAILWHSFESAMKTMALSFSLCFGLQSD
jgi:hypothetical protein